MCTKIQKAVEKMDSMKMDQETDNAWQTCRAYLTFDRPNLLNRLEAWEKRHSERIEVVRNKIDHGGLTEEEKQLLKELGIPYQYDRRIKNEK